MDFQVLPQAISERIYFWKMQTSQSLQYKCMTEVTCFQSYLYTNLTSVILCIAPLYFHLDMNYWLQRSLQSLSDKLEDEHRFQYHRYGVCLHFRCTDIIILPTRAVTAGRSKNLHLRLPLILVKLPMWKLHEKTCWNLLNTDRKW